MSKKILFSSVVFCFLFVAITSCIFPQKKSGNTIQSQKLIVLKLDDVVAGSGGQIVPERWQRVSDYLEGKQIKSSFGIIGFSLVDDYPAYFKWITERAARGYIEFWNHGFHPRTEEDTGEFERSYTEQLYSLRMTDSLARAKLNLNLTVWGPHWSGTTEDTDRALAQIPNIRMTFQLPVEIKHFKGFVFKNRLDIEYPTHNPDFEAFKKTWLARKDDFNCYFLQGHPNSWDETRWENFVKIIEFLQAEGMRFVTPSELLEMLNVKR